MRDDITRRAVLRASMRAQNIAERFHKLVPFGPDKVGMSKGELRKKVAGMSPEQRSLFAASVGGVDMALEMLNARPTA